MSIRYIIQVDNDTDLVLSITKAVNANESDVVYYKQIDGTPPNIGDTYTGRTYDEKRRSSYKSKADPLYMAWRASVDADADPQATQDTLKLAWTDKRDSIKTQYPSSQQLKK